ncbi:rop guanine nucleotide exchange factor 3-like protein [Carex littledalei]|uniref:Rop guanine nucleotide exchange factor 3-like protein n=1 Tax=Carex littledalei TaxID=544730 RepID=A0A833R5I3_9POAL|nr:rop guanine nucleotide exchange factor 3-like protein [Carex littledalei]
MMGSPMRRDDISNAYSHPSPGYGTSRYSRTYSNLSSSSHADEEESSNLETTPPPRIASRFAPRPPSSPCLNKLSMKKNVNVTAALINPEDEELELMKDKYTKLLLGEDMSGGGKGVCSAVAISNAITNLYATIFGTCHKLEPLPPEKKSMWIREMDCFLSICDFIVDPSPIEQTMPEAETAQPRMDIVMNLPALEKLENMLLDLLDSFDGTDFWYGDPRNDSFKSTKSFSRSEDKWWVPVPCLPDNGLSILASKELQKKRDCANQIHKAAMAINNDILAEMEVPESYITTLPKSGRLSVGDDIYYHMQTTDQFSAETVLSSLHISSEHEALEIADKVEAALYIWKRKVNISHNRAAWDMRSDLANDGDKNVVLSSRAKSLLLCLKEKYPSLSQTTLDTSKLHYNKDVGKAILESYSRILESLAYNIVSWIDDVLRANDSIRNSVSYSYTI